MVNCKLLLKEVEALEKIVGDAYGDALYIDKKTITEIENQIKQNLGSQFSDEVIECFVYRKVGIGNITPFIFDDNLEEIMIIGKDNPVYIFDRSRGMIPTEIYLEEREVRQIIQKVAAYSGRNVDASTPILDGRLPDGSRVNATLSAVTPKGSTLTIRKFNVEPLTILDLLRFNTFDKKLASFLWLVVEGLDIKPANIAVIGGTASGKTTTLNAMSSFIPEGKRIVSIEDTLEINLKHRHWVPMETRPPDEKGREVTMDNLLRNALRMRPDRIIVGEVRGSEALTLFTAMNTGHEGCFATIHANSAKDALTRLQSHPMNVPDMMMDALDIIIAQKRYTEKGKLIRRVFEVAEISGREGKNLLTNTLFKFDAKTGKLELNIMNGRIIQELSSLSNFTIKELDDEMYKRSLVLELMVDYDLTQKDIHRFIQDYYKHQDKTLEELHDEIKSRKKIDTGEKDEEQSTEFELEGLLKTDKKWEEKGKEW